MTPVDATSTCDSGRASVSAVACTIDQASAMPGLPVQALAEPELVTIAWATPSWIWARLTVTGAATTRLVVNTPAALAGRSDSEQAPGRPCRCASSRSSRCRR